ncbi:MAG: MFS transporter [Chloroflexi bacterium]|nr:MFS transporter [Chloroflexota bacterium]
MSTVGQRPASGPAAAPIDGGYKAREGDGVGGRVLASLKDPTYRWFWFGMVCSFFGMQVGQVARQWLVYELTGSSTYLGVVGAGVAIPTLLLSLPGGVLADRVRKKYLLMATQIGAAVVAFALASLILTGRVEPWHVVAATMLSGSIMAFNQPARNALISEIVPPERLTNAVALNSAGMNLSGILAPTVAGILVGIVGVAPTYYLHVFMFLVAVMFLMMLPKGMAGRSAGGRNPVNDMKEGLAYLTRQPNRPIAYVMLYAIFPIIFVLPYETLLPVFAKDILHMGSEGLGFMMGSVGIGALCGSMAVASLGNVRRRGRLILGVMVFYGLAAILFANSTYFPLSAVLLACMGAMRMVFLTTVSSYVQMAADPDYRGRIMGVYQMTWGLMPLGSLPAGFFADRLGAPMVLTAGGCILLAATATAFCIPSLRRVD